MSSLKPPVVVGTVTLDLVRILKADQTMRQMQFRFGGVCNNVVCALGVLGLKPRFVSGRFSGELGNAADSHLAENGVELLSLPYETPLSFFQAEVDETGEVAREMFTDNGALDQLTPYVLRDHEHAFTDAGVVLSCTDLALDSLRELHAIAHDYGAPFWVLSSSIEEVNKITGLRSPPEVIGMNRAEIEALSDRRLHTISEIAKLTQQLVAKNGVCLITLGSEGAILSQRGATEFLYQPVPRIVGKSSISAGDVLFACLLVAHTAGQKWDAALQFATTATIEYIKCGIIESKVPYQNLVDASVEIPSLQRISL